MRHENYFLFPGKTIENHKEGLVGVKGQTL